MNNIEQAFSIKMPSIPVTDQKDPLGKNEFALESLKLTPDNVKSILAGDITPILDKIHENAAAGLYDTKEKLLAVNIMAEMTLEMNFKEIPDGTPLEIYRRCTENFEKLQAMSMNPEPFNVEVGKERESLISFSIGDLVLGTINCGIEESVPLEAYDSYKNFSEHYEMRENEDGNLVLSEKGGYSKDHDYFQHLQNQRNEQRQKFENKLNIQELQPRNIDQVRQHGIEDPDYDDDTVLVDIPELEQYINPKNIETFNELNGLDTNFRPLDKNDI